MAPLLAMGGRQFQYRVTMSAAPPALEGYTASIRNADRSPILYEMDIAYLDATSGPTTSEAKGLFYRHTVHPEQGPATADHLSRRLGCR